VISSLQNLLIALRENSPFEDYCFVGELPNNCGRTYEVALKATGRLIEKICIKILKKILDYGILGIFYYRHPDGCIFPSPPLFCLFLIGMEGAKMLVVALFHDLLKNAAALFSGLFLLLQHLDHYLCFTIENKND